jgi:hypothetical protein
MSDDFDKSNKYINEFFDLTCYPDILDILNPISGRKKEITESMAVIRQIRTIVLKNPNKNYILYDLCAGNALTSTLASFLFKNIESFAVDKRVRDRDWSQIERFNYLKSNIKKDNWVSLIGLQRSQHIHIPCGVIIIGVHCCGELAKEIINIYNVSLSNHLIIMPCCTGGKYKYSIPQAIQQKIGNYLTWSMYLLDLVEGQKRLIVDDSILSPKNALIIANRGQE